MATDARYGGWVTMAGVITQMLGLATDLVLHRLNPALSFEANPLTLDNPGHVLLVIGLVITVIGVVWMLFRAGLEERSRATLVASAALAVFAVFAISSGLSAGQPARSGPGADPNMKHGHGAAPTPAQTARPSGAPQQTARPSGAPQQTARPSGAPQQTARPSGSPSR